jgi:hypothetical protein
LENTYLALGKVGVIDVQVRAQHVIYVLHFQAGLGEVLHVRPVQHVETRLAGALLVVTDAGVDQDGVMLRLQHPAMDAGDDPVGGGIVIRRRQPRQMGLDVLGVPIGEQHLRLEAMAQALLHAQDFNFADVEHLRFPFA